VAVKEVLLPPDLTDAERDELFQRTFREARAAGRLTHPNVVAVHDVVQAEGRPWIVMELVRSRSLYQVVNEDGPISPKRAAEIGLAVLAALGAAHSAGVWHRDVKPGNVLLADDGRVVLTDFGLATFDGDGTVTRSGIILGSAQYISPERARDGSSGPEADMWSLGATLYAAVEGRSPFARDSPMATLTALAIDPPDQPKRAGALRPVLIGLLRKNPRHRMKADEAARLLQRVIDDPKTSAGRKAARVAVQRAQGVVDQGAVAPMAAAVPSSQADVRTRTVTEETFRQVSWPTRRWGLVVALAAAVAVVGLVTPAVVILLNQSDPGAVAGPLPSSTPAPTGPVPTEAMRVQACALRSPAEGTRLSEASAKDVATYGLLPHWAYYRDPSGYAIAVPGSWTVSGIGQLVCFRDPNSAKTAAVFRHGNVAGNPVDLIANTTAWRSAANLTDFDALGIVNVQYDEGGADLEYTYQAGGIKMHGVNRMFREKGQVYTIYFLATEDTWSFDRGIKEVIQPSFSLAD
jgi:eukaryotic-like serine/threonine-protein kinase